VVAPSSRSPTGRSWPRTLATCAAIVLGILAFALVAESQDGREDEAAQDDRPIVIIAGPRSGAFESTLDASGFSHVIDVREAWRGYQSVGEVLARTVGVQVRNFGGREDYATVSVRGSTPAQVKILLDGVSMSRASDAVVNLADLPMDAVERIEVYRGFTPVRYAASGAASVINIITRKGDRAEAGGSVSYGSFESAKTSAYAAGPVAGGSLSGFFNYRRTDGDFEFVDNNGTELNPDDDFKRRRQNNDYESFDLLGRYVVSLANGSTITVSDEGFYKDEGTPGVGNAAQEATKARLRETRNVLATNWESPSRAIAASFDFTYLNEHLRDPVVPGGGDLGLPYPESDSDTYAFAWGANAAHGLGDYHYVELSAETGFETYHNDFPQNPGVHQDEERNLLALAAGDDIYMPGIALTLSPQLRQEFLWNRFDGEFAGLVVDGQVPSSYESSTDPRVGARWEPLPDVTFKGNVGSYFRPPTFGELFGNDGFSAPNPTLQPETGVNKDVGVLLRRDRLWHLSDVGLEYAYFDNDSDDMILLVQTGNRIPRPLNVNSTHTSGHEVRVALAGPGGTSLEANYTNQRATNESKVADFRGNKLPGLPDQELYARASIGRPQWSLTYEIEYRSSVFLDLANNPLRKVPDQTLHNLAVAIRPFPSAFEIKLEIDNLTDEQFFDQWQFPMPGRAFYVTASYAFDFSTGPAADASGAGRHTRD